MNPAVTKVCDLPWKLSYKYTSSQTEYSIRLEMMNNAQTCVEMTHAAISSTKEKLE